MMVTNMSGSFPVAQRINFPLQEENSITNLLIDVIGRGVIFLNGDGAVTFINRYATEKLQIQKEAVISKRVDMLPLRTPIYKLLSEERSATPLSMVIKGRVFSVQTTEICSGDGVAQGKMTEFWDITDERREKRQWEEFVVMMTHDLRSPLTVIMGYIQGIRCGMCGEVSNRIQSVLKKAELSGTTLNSMIEEMLDSCRLELGLLKMNPQYCDTAKILKDCYRDNLQAAHDQGLNLVMSGDERLPKLMADSKQLPRMFNNLVSNAIKFTPAGGEVSIVAEIADDALHVTVADTGIGIPPEDIPRIFNKYFRSAGVSDYKGSGLGLAISKAIVEALDGSIWVESTVGRGSRFTVSFPLRSGEGHEWPVC